MCIRDRMTMMLLTPRSLTRPRATPRQLVTRSDGRQPGRSGARGLGGIRAHALRIDPVGVRHFLSPVALESPSVSSMTSASTTSSSSCLLYTSDAADDLTRVDLG